MELRFNATLEIDLEPRQVVRRVFNNATVAHLVAPPVDPLTQTDSERYALHELAVRCDGATERVQVLESVEGGAVRFSDVDIRIECRAEYAKRIRRGRLILRPLPAPTGDRIG